MAILLILSWFAPQAAALGIHTHELLEHTHEGAAASGLAVHDAGHDHEVPSIGREIAPPVRAGKQKPAPAPSPAAIPPVVCPAPGSLIASGTPAADHVGPREGPPLSILHCSFLI